MTKDMSVPTEPIGSIPRPVALLEAMTALAAGRITEEQLHSAEEKALRDTIARFEETDFPVISDGEQTKPSFAMYPLPDGVVIPFVDGHMRRLPRLTAGRFGYGVHAAHYDGRIRRQHASAVFCASSPCDCWSADAPHVGFHGHHVPSRSPGLWRFAAISSTSCFLRGWAYRKSHSMVATNVTLLHCAQNLTQYQFAKDKIAGTGPFWFPSGKTLRFQLPGPGTAIVA